MSKRDHYKYHQKVGNRIVHTGITKDLDRREEEHQRQWSGSHIMKVGYRTTKAAALEWESAQRKAGKPTESPKGRRP